MKYAVVYLKRFEAGAAKIAAFLDAELCLYADKIFAELFGRCECIVAVMASGIAVRGVAPLLTDKWHDCALVVVTPDLSYAVSVLGGHHGANECVKRLAELGITPVISTATEVFGKPSVEEIAKREHAEIINKDSTREVNEAMLESTAEIVRVNPPKVVIANKGVSVLVQASPYVLGIGCRLGTPKEEILSAVRAALAGAGISPADCTIFATTQKKFSEAGLHEAAGELGVNLIFLD
ncbi:MAG: cobalt-precorrin 5A hydrolase, partial [Methanocorpusculum sp.]|nr:cobalt-precorrin 5A hydrolase [Methanocorpusculum sp.]